MVQHRPSTFCVDLPTSAHIESVIITNSMTCGNRLSNSLVEVLDEDNNSVSRLIISGTVSNGEIVTLKFKPQRPHSLTMTCHFAMEGGPLRR